MAKGKIDQHTALHFAFFTAAHSGQKDVVELLLRGGANIHEQNDLALRSAAEFGQTEIVRLLLENGANVHAKHDEALTLAQTNGHKATASLIRQWMNKRPPAIQSL